MRFVGGGDECLSIFGDVYATGALVFPEGAHVLEIGCAEADWMTPMLAQRPDLHLTGIDWRGCERPGTVIRGDVLTYDFPPASFDAVVGISSIEHIGLGHYDKDPVDVDGDTHCLERVVTWLKPGGWVYCDVPFRADGYQVVGDSHRIYDVATFPRLMVPGLRPLPPLYVTDQGLTTTVPPPTAMNAGRFHYVALRATKD